MAYVAPTSRSDGYVVDAAEWNKNTVDNPIALKALLDAINGAPVGLCNGRLTLTTGVPVTPSDVTAATTLYWTPYGGNRVALYDGSAWAIYTFTERSIAVPATTSQMYDVFVYNNAGTITLELAAWTNDTTRATALTTQDGVLVKTGALTRRYLGSFRTTGVSGQTEDSAAKRYVWNYYNRKKRLMRVVEATGWWTYTTAAYRQANNAATNQLEFVVGVAEDEVEALVQISVRNSGTGVNVAVGIGLNATNANNATTYTGHQNPAAASALPVSATYCAVPAIGRTYLAWVEYSDASGTTTWFGATANLSIGAIVGQVWA